MCKKVKIIGLTGGIASGKSCILDYFLQKQVPVIDADETARAVVKPDSLALNKIVDHFGSELLNQNGELNRTLLREKIFQSESERLWLNGLLHPLIETKTQEFFEQYQNEAYLIWAVPLLIETKLYKKVDRVLVVDCSQNIQLERLMKRDSITQELALRMIKSQLEQAERLKFADDIIHNHSDKLDLKKQIDALDVFYNNLT